MKLIFSLSVFGILIPLSGTYSDLSTSGEIESTTIPISYEISGHELTTQTLSIVDYTGDEEKEVNNELLEVYSTEPTIIQNNLPSITTGGIYIDEIFARDTAFLGEYIIIESLFNYSGAVEVVGLGQGAASKIFGLSIQTGEKVLITDDLSKLLYWTGKVIIQSSITLTDGGEELLLKISDISYDHIVYQNSSTDQALFYTEVDTTGRRVFLTFNTPSPTIGSGTNTSGDVSYEVYPIGSGGPISGNNFTGVITQSGDITLPLSESICPLSSINGSISITEIHPFDTDQFPEYIELLVNGIFIDPITIIGLGQGQAPKTLLLSGSQKYIIITDNASFFPLSTTTISLPSISLTNSGEPLQIIGHSGQVLDNTVYTAGSQGKSLYYSGESNDGEFNFSDLPSPGFDLNQVNHLLFDKNFTNSYSCSIDLQHTEPFFAGRKINLIASTNNKQIQNNSNNYSCEWQFNNTNYLFTGCNPSFFEFDTGGLYSIGVTITDNTKNQTCSTTLSINYPLDPTEGLSCKQNYYQELYLKRKDRFDYMKKGLGKFGLTATTSGDVYQKGSKTGTGLSILTGKVDIVSILPNPAGKDDNQEVITLKNNDTLPYELSTFVLFNGKSKKKLPPETPNLLPGKEYTITATLGLTNRPTCIKLQDTVTVYDTFCYPQAGDDQLFTVSLDSLQTVSDQDPKLLSQVTLALEPTQACALFDKQQVVCKALRFADSLVNEYKKQAKKSISLEKKLAKEATRTASYKQKYSDQKSSRSKDKKEFSLKLKAQKVAQTLARNQTRLVQGYVQLLTEELETNRYQIYKSSKIPGVRKLYTLLSTELKNNKLTHSRGGVSIPTQEIELLYNISQNGLLPLQQTEVGEAYQGLFNKTQQTVDEFLNNLTITKYQIPP